MVGEVSKSLSKQIPFPFIGGLPPPPADQRRQWRPAWLLPLNESLHVQPAGAQPGLPVLLCCHRRRGPTRAAAPGRLSPVARLLSVRWSGRSCLQDGRTFRVRWWPPFAAPNLRITLAVIMRSRGKKRKKFCVRTLSHLSAKAFLQRFDNRPMDRVHVLITKSSIRGTIFKAQGYRSLVVCNPFPFVRPDKSNAGKQVGLLAGGGGGQVSGRDSAVNEQRRIPND